MMQLVTHPHPALREHTNCIESMGVKERDFLIRMLEHMRTWQGIGLAAPQVASTQQLIVAEADGDVILWANPKILESKGKDYMQEGCLSLPDTLVDVERSAHVWVRALDTENRKIERKLRGLLARVVQHEIDHLSGTLIIDHGPALPKLQEQSHEA